MANYSAGDGTYLDEQFGGYGIPDYSEDDQMARDMQQGAQDSIPLFGSQQYREGKTGVGDGSLLAATNTGTNMQDPSTGQSFVPSSAQMMSDGDFGVTTGNTINAGVGGYGAVANGVGAVVGSYQNASTDTGSSVLSGAASGAAAGAAFGPWGAVAGAVIGGIAGFFGSKSKKKAVKKAYQMDLEKAIAPQRQAQANWLQQEGLKQAAFHNYASGYTPGGFKYTNGLLGHPSNPMFGVPTQAANIPNFNQAPPDVVAGSGDKDLGITGNITPNNGLLSTQPSAASHAPSQFTPQGFGTAPTGFAKTTAMDAPVAPTYSFHDKDSNQSNLTAYQKAYTDYFNNQRDVYEDNALSGYTQYAS